MTAWLYLFVAIVFGVAGTTAMKLSVGFTKTLPSILIFVCYAIAFIFLTLTLKKLPVSTAYAIWAGLGTLLISIIGAYCFHEGMSLLKMGSILLIILGVIGLNLMGTHA